MKFKEWFAQAVHDLEFAESALRGGYFSYGCFLSQQAAEKVLKALGYFRGYDLVKGHSVREIAENLGILDRMEEWAKVLDIYYISTRYPDALPAGAPFQAFTKTQAEQAVDFANHIINLVRAELGDALG